MTVQKRLEQIRKSIKNENISYGEIVELQNLKAYIQPDDIELLQWVNDPEPKTCECGGNTIEILLGDEIYDKCIHCERIDIAT